jgi:hypothetical protein
MPVTQLPKLLQVPQEDLTGVRWVERLSGGDGWRPSGSGRTFPFQVQESSSVASDCEGGFDSDERLLRYELKKFKKSNSKSPQKPQLVTISKFLYLTWHFCQAKLLTPKFLCGMPTYT